MYEEEFVEEPFVDDAEVQRILGDYHRKQMIENLTGPGISLVCHVVLLILGFVFIVTNEPPKDPPLVVETAIVEELEVEEEIIEEIEIEEVTEDDVPTTDPTEAPADNAGEETSPVDVSDDAPQTDDDQEMEEVLDIVKTNSPLTYVGPMGGRSDAGRRKAVGKYGGSRGGQSSVNRALRWLASVQNANGSWGDMKVTFSHEPGHPAHTGLALLVFLAHGETPLSEKYGKTVQNAMRWLAEYGSQSNLKEKVFKRGGAYTHGIATYAISEAYAMTKIPFVQAAMENSIDVLIQGQMASGGFGYSYAPGARWDMSVAGWNMQALKAGRMAGCSHQKLKDSIRKSINFCKLAYGGKGGFGYATTAGNHANMGGVGTVAMQLLGASDDKRVREGCERIGNVRLKAYEQVMADPTKWESLGSKNLYGWYYDTQAIFNSQNKEKARWKSWRKAFESVLIRAQHDEGYWETNGHGTGPTTPGRVLSTCWAALQLEVYYRYLPTFDKAKLDKFAADDAAEGIDGVGDGDGGGMVIEIGNE